MLRQFSLILALGLLGGPAIGPLSAQGVITTLAGKEFVYPRLPQAGLQAPLGPVADVAWGLMGELYIADPRNRLVLKLTPDGSVGIFAGNGFDISSGDGGPANRAGLRSPVGLAVGPDGSVYIADAAAHKIRRVTPDGVIRTFAGNGQAASSGDGLRAPQASLNEPWQMAFDGIGALYVAEKAGDRIRKIDRLGVISTDITATQPVAVTVDPQGVVWFGDARGLNRYLAGMPSTLETPGAGLTIGGLTADPMGIVAWSTGERHQVFSMRGTSGQIVGNGTTGLVVGNGFPGSSGDGGPATEGRVDTPLGLAYAPDGRLAIADSGNGLVRQVDTRDMLSRLAGSQGFRFTGDGGPAPLATLNSPQGVAVGSGRVLIADTNSNKVRAIGTDGVIESLPSGTPGGDSLNPTSLSRPTDVVEAGGEVYVADRGNVRVAQLTARTPITVAGGGFVRNRDNLPATEARLFDPTSVAFDALGNLILTDREDDRVRLVRPDGIIEAFAGSGAEGASGDGGAAVAAAMNGPRSVATAPNGDVYIVDELNNRVRKVDPSGVITRVAGAGPAGFSGDGQSARDALLNRPTGVAVGPDGSVYIADSGNHRIRKVGLNQVIETVAGTGNPAYSGDGGFSTQAALRNPTGLDVDAVGNLFIADEGNDRIRTVLAQLPQFFVNVGGQGGPNDLIELSVFEGQHTPARVIDLAPELAGLRYEVLLFDDGALVSSLPWLDVSPLEGAMPASLRVIGKGVETGVFEGSIAVRIRGAGANETISIDVSLVVEEEPAANCPNNCTDPFTALGLDRNNAVFATYQGGAAESIVIEPKLIKFKPPTLPSLNEENGPTSMEQRAEFELFASASTDDGGTWLSVVPSSAMTFEGEPPPFEITANPLQLSVGTYTGVVEFSGSGIPPVELPVTMTVAPSKPKLAVDRTGLTFRAASQGPSPLERRVTITNAGTGLMDWSAATETLEGSGWLSISARSGDVIGETEDADDLLVSVNPAGLAPGDYFGSVEITAPGTTPQSVTVIFNVAPAGELLPPDLSRNGLVFTSAGGVSPGSQDVTFANVNSVPVSYTALLQGSDDTPAILHAPRLGVLDPGERETVRVQPNFELMPFGVARERLAITFSEGGSSDVEITTVKVDAPVALSEEGRPAGGGCERSSLIVTPTSGTVVQHPKGQPMDLEALVVDNCGAPFTGGASSVPVKFSAPGSTVDLSHNSDGLWAGSYQPREDVGQFNASYTAIFGFSVAQEDVTIELIEGADVPLIGTGGLVNAASFEQAPQISPGSLISLFGESLAEGSAAATTAPLPEQLAGSQVKLGDRTLKLFFAGGNQINAQIPFDIEPNLQHRIEIRRGNAASVPEQVTVAPTQPGIFAVNQAGSGQAVIVDAFTFVISDTQSPATAGAALSAFCTGLGAVDPPAPEGEQAPFSPLSRTVNDVTVRIGDQQAEVLFAGLAPGFAGLYQVNFIVPPGAPTGDAVPVTLTVDGKTSPPVTIAIE